MVIYLSAKEILNNDPPPFLAPGLYYKTNYLLTCFLGNLLFWQKLRRHWKRRQLKWLWFHKYCRCNTQNTSTFVLQLSVIFKGPGWTPGKPRLGDPGDIPEVCDEFVFFVNCSILYFFYMYLFMFLISYLLPQVENPIRKYDSCLSSWGNLYVLVHFVVAIIAYQMLIARRMVREACWVIFTQLCTCLWLQEWLTRNQFSVF